MTDGESDPVVLVVDDEDDIVEMFTLYLEPNYEVRTASNGSEALVELDPDVDVMLLDRRMPEMTGDEVLDHLDEMPLDCYVIMVTAVDPEFDIVEMPIEDYICKPASKDEINQTIEQVLLLDEYESLLHEYFAVTKKYATLEANRELTEEDSDSLATLDERRQAIRERIETTVADLPDETFTDALQEIHSPG